MLAIARAEAKKKHGLKRERVEIQEIIYVPRVNVYVALYKIPDVRDKKSRIER